MDVLIITETQIGLSFPNSQFMIEVFSMPCRLDKNWFGGGVMVYIQEDIPSKQLAKYKFPDDTEVIFIEINLRKTNWLIFGTYCRPSQSVEYFFKHIGFVLDTC